MTLLALLFLAGCNKLKARDELHKGVRAYKAGQLEAAIVHFQRAIDLDPDSITARLYLATAYAVQFVPRNPSEENLRVARTAISAFEKALEQDPDNTNALTYIASLYLGMGGALASEDWEEAKELYEKSKEFRRRLIRVAPKNPEHYYSIAVIDWAMAHRMNSQMRANLNQQADEPLPARQRRQLREQNEELVEEGIEMIEAALKVNPSYVDAIAYLNLLYRQKADIVDTPEEREHYLQLADDAFERQKRLRKELEAADATPAN
ncbi:MAG: tetratricopeptide repeat protein [Candidatus Acidoferrales bacterium]